MTIFIKVDHFKNKCHYFQQWTISILLKGPLNQINIASKQTLAFDQLGLGEKSLNRKEYQKIQTTYGVESFLSNPGYIDGRERSVSKETIVLLQ